MVICRSPKGKTTFSGHLPGRKQHFFWGFTSTIAWFQIPWQMIEEIIRAIGLKRFMCMCVCWSVVWFLCNADELRLSAQYLKLYFDSTQSWAKFLCAADEISCLSAIYLKLYSKCLPKFACCRNWIKDLRIIHWIEFSSPSFVSLPTWIKLPYHYLPAPALSQRRIKFPW